MSCYLAAAKVPIKIHNFDKNRLATNFSSIGFYRFSIESIEFIDSYRFLSIIDSIDCTSRELAGYKELTEGSNSVLSKTV